MTIYGIHIVHMIKVINKVILQTKHTQTDRQNITNKSSNKQKKQNKQVQKKKKQRQKQLYKQAKKVTTNNTKYKQTLQKIIVLYYSIKI